MRESDNKLREKVQEKTLTVPNGNDTVEVCVSKRIWSFNKWDQAE